MKRINNIMFPCFAIILIWICTALTQVLIDRAYAQEVTANDASEKNSIVRAKIGIQIQSGEKAYRSRSRERLLPGDLIRLYVHTENSCYLYVVHTDTNSVNLLNITEQKIQSSTLILPSAQAFYEIDGTSSMEKITIICTPEKLPELSVMESRNLTYKEWSDTELALKNRSKLLVVDEEHETFAIAGNVRGLDGNSKTGAQTNSVNSDQFLKELQIFSGNGLLVKKYEFQIKK
ncbi:exported hypothetical protein [Desulfamplus magnetovallimortis]|uniref:DUF4384 domain-containing protein n=1 Tax=Desulfamplus magnetovallimortis TaxID=1246637 RepID=A0A1W1H751_9BACT|nr:hypothetical protein [Desulfamplus magnetovallimortis]SLM28256.1 exported hypothetical protein [Desulfamplus magnetovallimortis]